MKAEKIIKETKKNILESIKDKLENIKDKEEIYFHDIVSEEIDSNTPQDRQECLNLIDLSNPKNFDSGMIDNRSLDRTLITMAYCSLEENIFNDDFIQELQSDLNNEEISLTKANEILKKINKVLKEEFKTIFPKIKDNSTQVFIKTSFSVNSLTREDFIKYGLLNKQVLDLSDSIKILTSNKSINQNAIVINEKKRDVEKKVYLFRVYLMDKDKEIDIRNFLKLRSISKETGFNLSPNAYIEQTTEQYENDKLSFKKNYLSEFKDKTLFIKTIVEMSNRLTEISLNGIPKETGLKSK
jgi:hypothetical protein